MLDSKIFVQIASYRDKELPKTIDSAIKNAKFPENLTFGIVNQFDEKTNRYIDARNIRMINIPWQNSEGVGEARYLCGAMWDGEDFSLQIDSHTRFAKDWDEQLISEWLSCDDEKAVLSTFPAEFYYDENGSEIYKEYRPTQIYVKEVWQSIPKLISKHIPIVDKPIKGIFSAGGFQFMGGAVCHELPYIREIWFLGEEAARSVQFYSHGYNIYIPSKLPLFHLYHRQEIDKDSHYLWLDMKEGELREKYDTGTRYGYETAKNIMLGKNHIYVGSKRGLQKFYNKIQCEIIDGELKKQT